jgi:hypothetical protein
MVIDNVMYITLADYARLHAHNGDRLRGMARDGKLLDTKQIFGNTWIIARDATVPVSTSRTATRPDGRKPYTAYFTPDELTAARAAVPDAEFIDPRAVSRAKRAAKRDAE